MSRGLEALCTAVWLGSLVPLLAGFALVRLGLGAPKWGLGLFALGALAWLLAGLFSAGVAVRQLVAGQWPGAIAWLAGLLFLALVIIVVRGSGLGALRAPSIHDVSTDLENPPVFEAASKLREPWANSAEWAGVEHAMIQAAAYPDVQGLLLPVPAEQGYRIVLAAIRASDWQIIAEDPEGLRVEAVAQTPLWHFRDDIAVRVTSTGVDQCRVDMRSASRIGVGDLGANARRIKHFFALLEQRSGS